MGHSSSLTSSNDRLHARWDVPAPHSYSLHLDGFAASTSAVRASIPPRLTKDSVNTRFGKRLRDLRHERRLTQSTMARTFGIDRSFISDVERGKKAISLPMLEIVALGMNLSLSALFEDV